MSDEYDGDVDKVIEDLNYLIDSLKTALAKKDEDAAISDNELEKMAEDACDADRSWKGGYIEGFRACEKLRVEGKSDE